MYISSDSAYRCLGGALAVIDPKSEKIDVYHYLIRDQNLPTLVWERSTGLLWGGTDRWGQMRRHPPTHESLLIYAFDPRKREVVARLIPWPGSDETSVLGVSGEGVLIAASGSEIALIETTTRTVLYKGTSPIGVPKDLEIGADGHTYCLSGGILYRWNLKVNAIQAVARTKGCCYLTEPSPGMWILSDKASVYRIHLETLDADGDGNTNDNR